MNEYWQRLEEVIKWTGMSINAFALAVGLKRSENLYQIRKGNNGISKELANVITTKYPNISKAWLIAGEGTMFLDDEKSSAPAIPFYDSDIRLLKHNDNKTIKPQYYISMQPFSDCDLATRCVGASMEPQISNGSIVMLKKVEISNVIPGEMYLVETEYGTHIRYVRLCEDRSKWRLVAANNHDYDDLTVKISDVAEIYIVKGVIAIRNN